MTIYRDLTDAELADPNLLDDLAQHGLLRVIVDEAAELAAEWAAADATNEDHQ